MWQVQLCCDGSILGIHHVSSGSTCHDCGHTYPCLPYPNLSTSFPSHQNHPSTQCQSWTLWLHSEPTRVLATHSQILWPPCVSSMHSWPNAFSIFSLLMSSPFPTPTLIPVWCYSTFSLLASSPFLTFHWSCDHGQAKPDCVPSLLDTS